MFGNIMEQKAAFEEMKQLAEDPTDHPVAQELVDVIVTMEYAQLGAVEELHDAMDLDVLDVQKDRDERREQLLAVIDAVAPGGRDLETMWFEEVGSEHLDNPERAQSYAGLDEDEWTEQIESWADTWRDHLDGSEAKSDRELAAVHVDRRFGVDLEVFEANVVEWDRGEALETLLATNFEAVETGIQMATTEAQAADQEQQEQEDTTA